MANEKNTALAENVQMLSELGMIGDTKEVKMFRERWQRLSEIQKAKVIGMLFGATTVYSMPDGGGQI